MLEQNEYLVTWAVYYGAVLGLLLVWWRMTRPIPWISLKQLLRLLVAALLLVPAPVSPDRVEMAPALIVLLFDSMLVKDGGSLHASIYLLYGLGLGLVGLVLDGIVRFLFKRRGNSELN